MIWEDVKDFLIPIRVQIMAELLLRTTDGAICHAEEDGSAWNWTAVWLPVFLIVRVPGLSVLDARNYVGPRYDADGSFVCESKAKIEYGKYLTNEEIENIKQNPGIDIREIPESAIEETFA